MSAAVAKRSSQKADLMQYLAGHSSTVGRMLGTIPEQNAARSSSSTTSILAASAPAALSPATQAAAAAASARRSSISAYLKGQQDLLTTITDGVPYASGVVSMLDGMGDGSNAERGSSSGGSSSSLVSSQSAASIAAAAAVQVNSRQSAVKEALSARISKAGRLSLLQLGCLNSVIVARACSKHLRMVWLGSDRNNLHPDGADPDVDAAPPLSSLQLNRASNLPPSQEGPSPCSLCPSLSSPALLYKFPAHYAQRAPSTALASLASSTFVG